MPKKCNTNILCIQNINYLLFIVLIVIISLFGFYLFNLYKNNNFNSKQLNNLFSLQNQINNDINYKKQHDKMIAFDNSRILSNQSINPYFTNPNYMMSNNDSIYLNPYMPPLKTNFFYDNLFKHKLYEQGGNINLAPINIPTSHYNFEFKQIGILTRSNGPEMILPLFGRPLHSNRNKWQYYTTTNNNNIIKLPVSRKGKSCTGDYGCDELFNGDSVYVEGYKDAFNATIYENNTPRYIPF